MKNPHITAVFGAIFVVFGFHTLHSQTPTANTADPKVLQFGQPIERELKGGEAHSYTLTLVAGQFLNVVVEQKGIDVVVKLFDPSGEKVADVDSPNGTEGPEPLSMVIEKTGNYRLQVSSLEKSSPTGRYEARIVELRTATESDNSLLRAKELLNKGESLLHIGSAESLRQGMEQFKEAISLFRLVGDRSGEAKALLLSGDIYFRLGNIDKSLESFNKALELYRALNDVINEAECLGWLGDVNSDIGELQQALQFYKQSLSLSQSIRDKQGEAMTLNGIGIIYRLLGESQNAITTYENVLLISNEIGEKRGVATALINIGSVYWNQGDYTKAHDFYNRALQLCYETGDKGKIALSLNNIGTVFGDLGDQTEALEYYKKALSLRVETNDLPGQANSLSNIGDSFRILDRNEDAQLYLNRALELRNKLGDKLGIATILDSLADIQLAVGNYRKASELDEQALALASAAQNKQREIQILFVLSAAREGLTDYVTARQYLDRALSLSITLNNKRDLAEALGAVAGFWRAKNNSNLSILYGKLAINGYQEVRQENVGLDKELQKGLLARFDVIFRNTLELLLKDGRFSEAIQVFNIYKNQQVFDSNLFAALILTPNERGFANSLAQYIKPLEQIVSKIEGSRLKIGRRELTPEEMLTDKTLESSLEKSESSFVLNLKNSEIEFTNSTANSISIDEIPDVEELRSGLRETSRVSTRPAAAVYTLVDREDFHALLITPTSIKAVSVPIKGRDLNEKTKQFWALLQSDKYDTTKLGKELFDIVFKPIEKELPAGTKTILWSLDGNLRYIPISALYDGKQFLVERYNNVVFTRADKDRMTSSVSPIWTGVGSGTSKAETVELMGSKISFTALPGVTRELSAVFRQPNSRTGVLEGETLEDSQFTKANFLDALKQHRPVVHIASHFSFRPGDEARSFLLMGDGTPFTLEEMKQNKDMFLGVELLTLSACNTAAQQADANGREVDAFFELAQRLGAQSVLATLWSVADNSTPWLMRDFYDLKLNKGLNKAEALRMAQLSLLKGKATVRPAANRGDQSTVIQIIPNGGRNSGDQRSSDVVEIESKDAPLYKKTGKPQFAHPYYWAPFVLIGNWR